MHHAEEGAHDEHLAAAEVAHDDPATVGETEEEADERRRGGTLVQAHVSHHSRPGAHHGAKRSGPFEQLEDHHDGHDDEKDAQEQVERPRDEGVQQVGHRQNSPMSRLATAAAARPATTRRAPKAKPFMPALWRTAPSTSRLCPMRMAMASTVICCALRCSACIEPTAA